ncbi:hypothetical protein D9M71_692980 [compost metagenome]
MAAMPTFMVRSPHSLFSLARGSTNSLTASLPSLAWQNLCTILVKPFSASPWVMRILRPSRSSAWMPVVPSYSMEIRLSRTFCSMPHSAMKPWPP